MSNFSAIYRSYDDFSNITNDLNESSLILKRNILSKIPSYVQKHPRIQVSKEEVDSAYEALSNIISDLLLFCENEDTSSILYELMDNNLFREKVIASTTFKSVIENLLDKLNNRKEIEESDLIKINEISDIYDNESSILYRKLRQGR